LSNEQGLQLFFLQKDIRVQTEEIISLDKFTINFHSFTEAQTHNLGLNRKVAIDAQGHIRNAIGHPHSFGIVNQQNIQAIISQANFQEKWLISNTRIEKCKDCQYRFCCLSNSDIESKNGLYYKIDNY